MRDIEKKAMALLNASEKKMGLYKTKKPPYELPSYVALYLSIEQHEAFKRKVSDAVETHFKSYFTPYDLPDIFKQFIIKPDPLVEVIEKCAAQLHLTSEDAANALRAAMEARRLEIREKGQ
jgi:hypothetical protein